MVYESSYESGRKPFRPDITRGYWAKPTDFLYACWGLAFKMDIFFMSWYLFFELGTWSIIPYLFCTLVYVVPIILIQSFLGQFSSSGFIAAFRISPLFKGIGYISLALNFSILTYSSMFASIPLLYLVHACRPTLPWSCESFAEWSIYVPEEDTTKICNNTKYANISTTTVATPSSSEENYADFNSSDYIGYSYHRYQVPSVIFFRSFFTDYKFGDDDMPFSLSWELLLCVLLVWALIALVFYKIVSANKMGTFIRYTIWLLVALLLICVTRFTFLVDATSALKDFFLPDLQHVAMTASSVPLIAVSSFGAGWGTIVSLSSYNKFKTNIMRYSWLISLGQLLILMLFGMATFMIERRFASILEDRYYPFVQQHWIIYMASGSALVDMELANMWSILFFGLLTIAAMLIMVINLFALLTAVFDEFEYLRPRKQEVTFMIIGLLALCSIYFCSNHGLTYFTALSADALITQTALNLLLILLVLWIYGRERFQRDIEFMLGQRFSTWRTYLVRFITPLALLIILLLAISVAFFEHYFAPSLIVSVAAIIFIGIPWLFIPGYAVLSLVQTSGTLLMRFKRCCHPTDWYPVEPEERQRYEESMGNMDITHQLNEVGEEVL